MIRAPLLGLALVAAVGCGSTNTNTPMHGPVVEFERMDRATMRIIRGTADLSELDYQRARPRLAVRLQRLEFTADQAQEILTRVDDARADRARLHRWWASLGNSDPRQARR